MPRTVITHMLGQRRSTMETKEVAIEMHRGGNMVLSGDLSPLREVNLLKFSSSKLKTDEKENYLSFLIRIHY